MAVSFHILVEQKLFTGYFGALVELWWVPVVGIGYRATTVYAILLSLKGPRVVPPVATSRRHR
ncbi:Uncharacterised protein [Mycobacterium tuberculosis]|uniref:Uncharacterized protein n=1 Tax=Mycobacterium tuberculosis TaxID=1773 RepID=A0A916L9H4_MYCTX|nr:Uncharacterised protein [Mycobacterium tuberculosis]